MKLDINKLFESIGVKVLNEEAKYIPRDQLIKLAAYKFIAPCFYFVSSDDEGDWDGDLALITDVPKNITKTQCQKLFKMAGCPDCWAEEVLMGDWRQYSLEPGRQYSPTLVQDMTFEQWVEQELAYYNEQGDFNE